MSYDRYEREYHLTPTGWVLGTFYFYSHAEESIAPPSDRVLTIIKEVKQSSGYSPEGISWREEWRSPDATDTRIKQLQGKFGERPSHTE